MSRHRSPGRRAAPRKARTGSARAATWRLLPYGPRRGVRSVAGCGTRRRPSSRRPHRARRGARGRRAGRRGVDTRSDIDLAVMQMKAETVARIDAALRRLDEGGHGRLRRVRGVKSRIERLARAALRAPLHASASSRAKRRHMKRPERPSSAWRDRRPGRTTERGPGSVVSGRPASRAAPRPLLRQQVHLGRARARLDHVESSGRHPLAPQRLVRLQPQ